MIAGSVQRGVHSERQPQHDERVTVHGRRNNDERVQLKLGEGASIIH